MTRKRVVTQVIVRKEYKQMTNIKIRWETLCKINLANQPTKEQNAWQRSMGFYLCPLCEYEVGYDTPHRPDEESAELNRMFKNEPPHFHGALVANRVEHTIRDLDMINPIVEGFDDYICDCIYCLRRMHEQGIEDWSCFLKRSSIPYFNSKSTPLNVADRRL